MKALAAIIVSILVGLFAWFVGSRLSADAIGMGVGLVFGVLAGIPTALLVMAAGRRSRASDEDDEEEQQPSYPGYGRGQYPAPVIVLAGPPAPQGYPPPGYGQPGYGQAGYGQPGYGQPWPGQSPTVDGVSYPVRQALPGPGAPGAPGSRVFRVVGEKDEEIDEW